MSGEFSVPIPNTGRFESIASPELSIPRGEGPGVFSASLTQGWGAKYAHPPTYKECNSSTSVTVTPIQGALTEPQPGIAYREGFASSYFRLVLSCPWEGFEDFSQASTAPIMVSIGGGGAHRRLKIPDVCPEYGLVEDGIPSVRTRVWGMHPGEAKTGLALILRPRTLQPRHPVTMRFSITQTGKSLGSGRFKMEKYSQPSRFIYEGSDAFVNYCINHAQEINSSEGRLYCFYPGYHRAYTSALHWSAAGTH
jgi:hypothetical protein